MDISKVIAEEGETKRTRIMYKANLAWTVLNSALDSMEKKGIVTSKETPSGIQVSLTPSGLDLLKRFSEVESTFIPLGAIEENQPSSATERKQAWLRHVEHWRRAFGADGMKALAVARSINRERHSKNA